MTVAVRLPSGLMCEAKKYASIHFRTAAKQIEYWVYLGKLADENPDLPASFIMGCLEAKGDMESSNISKFEFIEE